MKNCVICKGEGKYKCPTCLVYYCSVSCCKTHREGNCEISAQPKEETITTDEKTIRFVTRDTVARDKLELLEHNKELKDALQNPHLRKVLQTIDTSDNPEEIMHKAMQEPIFVEFANACLKVVEPDDGT